MLHFLKKLTKNTCRYHYQNLDDMIYNFPRYRAKHTETGHFWSFFALSPPKNPKNQNFQWKNLLEISSFCTCVPKITTIWCTVPEIRSETGRAFCHFGSFFALLTPPSTLPNDPKNQNLKKKVNKCLEILSFYTYMYTVNEDHMIYGSWNISCNRHFCHFGPFSPFQPPDNLENQYFKIKKKKQLEILSFYTFAPKMTIIWCMAPEIWSATDRIFCHSGPFFALLPP